METAVSKVLFYEALGERVDEYTSAGCDVLDVLPDIPESCKPACEEAVKRFVGSIAEGLGLSADADEWEIEEAFEAQFQEDRYAREWPVSAENIGHYAVMTAAGEGVGLWEFVQDWHGSALEKSLSLADDVMTPFYNAVYSLSEEDDD